MKDRKIGISVFLVAFAFGLNITGIAPVLGILKGLYGSRGTEGVQFLQTLSYGLLMVGSLSVGWLTGRFSKKRLVLAGLFLIGVCGMLPLLKDGYGMLVVSRFLIGLGFGIASPLNTAIIAEFIEPQERARYLGLHVVGMGFGSMVGNFAGGLLAGFGYRFFYLVYGIAFLCMAGVWVFLPETPPVAGRAGGGRLNGMVYLVSAASFVHTLFITAYSTNIGIFISENMTGGASLTGVVTAVNAAFALLVGAGFARISAWLGRYALAVSVLAAAVGFLAVLGLPGVAGLCLGSACCGASLSCFMAQCSYLISVSTEPAAVAKASGIFGVIGGIGGFVSPLLLGAVAGALPGGNSSANQFLISFAGMAVLGCLVLYLTLSGSLLKRKVFRIEDERGM